MNIVIVLPHFHRRKTGLTTSLLSVVKEFKKSQNVILIGNYLGYEKTTSLIEFFRIVLYIKEPIVIHVGRNIESLFGIIVKMFFFTKNIKVVYTRHSETSPSYLSRYMFYLCDQVVTLTMKVKKDFPLPSICIPHGVDADHYSFQPKSHISFPKCKKFIGVVGRVRPEKGQKDVLMAALPLLQSDSELGLIILGKVKRSQLSYKNMINHMALTYGVKNQIFFIDTVEDIRPYYQMFSITIVASYSEGFSMVPLEVMASSKLVIATHDVGIHDELIMNGQTGYLFNAGNIDELSTLLKDNLYKNDKLKMIGLNARREILLNWTIETESRRLIALYESLFI